MPQFTPVEHCILAVLRDRRRHTRLEIAGCLWDSIGTPYNIYRHITSLRRKLAAGGKNIISENHGGGRKYYRLVPLAAPSANGRTSR